ncbi:FtsX-like permease family protein [Acidaminobacterium chupaoyuni]
MRKAKFFFKLAFENLKKNKKFYLPYLLTIMATTAAYDISVTLAGAADLPDITRYNYLAMFMSIGSWVIALFAGVFLTYTNSFLMKRRRKELGLYHILGLDKRNIALMLGAESFYTALAGICGGVLMGMLLQKLMTLLLYKIMGQEAYFGFYVSPRAILQTVLLFSLILLANLVINLFRMHRQNPIEMLQSGSAGEREPKTRWLTTLIGILALGGGYWLAVTAEDALAAVGIYFIAVFLVIIGTYCLFTAVSITMLKLLRRNKKYYYRTNHFIGVSGMLYRMRRNAVGLSNICILSTMVLVMVSGTLSLYRGSQTTIAGRFPGNIGAEVSYEDGVKKPFSKEEMLQRLEQAMAEKQMKPSKVYEYHWLGLLAKKEGSTYALQNGRGGGLCQLCLISKEEYSKISSDISGEQREMTLRTPDDQELRVEGILLNKNLPAAAGAFATPYRPYWIVVESEEQMQEIYRFQKETIHENMSWNGFWNVTADAKKQMELPRQLESAPGIEETGDWQRLSVESKEAFRQDYYSLNSGFFFLGLFLGALFLMAAVLIIYYKQISEGYEDRERYLIMQKVGMEQRTVKRSINSQILVVFFAPLTVAAVHIAFNYGVMCKLLTLFSLYDVAMILQCTLGTFAVFACIYALVYKITAGAYYKIVRS